MLILQFAMQVCQQHDYKELYFSVKLNCVLLMHDYTHCIFWIFIVQSSSFIYTSGEDQLPDIEIRQDDVDSRNITGTISFPFDITNIINRPLSLYIVLRQKTQIISMQQIQIQFKGNRIVQFRTFLNVSSPGIYNIRYKISFFGEDPETSNPITVNLTIPG